MSRDRAFVDDTILSTDLLCPWPPHPHVRGTPLPLWDFR